MRGPLRVSARLQRLRQTTPGEYLLRFAFGGLVTVGAGLAANQWGPVVGGLFLAFPSILPASLTLVAKHARLSRAAGANALGAVIGSGGLFAFALVGWPLAEGAPAWATLSLAILAWLVVALGGWAAFQMCHLRR
jgi:Protein of unknown function (DUF3147)